MTFEILLLLLIVAAAVVLFWGEWVAADAVALGVMLALVLSGLVPAERAFAGFGSDTVLLLLGLLVLTAALLRTGVVEIAGRLIVRHTGDQPRTLLLVVMIAVSLLSAFVSNTAATAFFLPVVLSIAARARLDPSALLMPLAFASICSSSVTLISTTTNIVVSGVMTQYGLEPMGMFELSPVGLPIMAAGIAYMFLLGARMLGRRGGREEDVGELARGAFLTEVLVPPGSKLAGRTIAETGLERDLDLELVDVVRDEIHHRSPHDDLRLEEGDVLLVQGPRANVLKVKDLQGLEIKAEVKLAEAEDGGGELRVVEVLLMPRCPLVGRTLKRAKFREAYGLQVLGIDRHEQVLRDKISQIPLRVGDVLLLQGRPASLRALAEDDSFRVLGVVQDTRPNLSRAGLAVAIFVGSIALGSVGLTSFAVAVLLGAVLAFATGCITPQEAYREVEWSALVLVASMLSVGIAMETTGAARFLAGEITALAGGLGPTWLIAAFFLATVALTQPMSNQAAAIVLLPVAIETARQLGVNPRTFAMTIAVAASCSYLTPLEPSCLLVYGPGRYRFFDFVRVGSPLTLLILALSLALIPAVWPL